MNIDTTVSVIIPAYNSSRFVGHAIESALAQTVKPLEIIVVDDGSTDDTAEIASRYGSPVRVIRQSNRGPSAARNRGAFEAQGAWLGLLDSDDEWFPRKLERQLLLAGDPRVGVIHCKFPGDDIPDRLSFAELWKRNRVITPSTLIRRSAFFEVGGFDEELTFSEDYNLWLRLAARGWEIAVCRQRLFDWDPQPDGLSAMRERMARDELKNIAKVGLMMNMPEAEIRSRQLVVCAEYARDMVNHRELKEARRLLLTRPSVRNLGWLLTTFAPISLLDWRRRLVHGSG